MSESRSMVRLTFAMAVASWVAVGAAVWGVQAQREDAQAQRQDARELLHAQIGAELDKQFDSTEMRKARKAFAKELLKHPGQLPNEDRVLSFFDKVGTYLRLGRIDDDTTYSSFSYYAERYWAAAKPSIGAIRKQENDPGYYGDFETLNGKMLKDDAEDRHRSITDVTPSRAKVDEFLKEEAVLNP